MRFINEMTREEAIELMEPGRTVTDEELDRLANDADLSEACTDLFVASTMLARQYEPQPDAEKALRQFHERHARHFRLRPLHWVALAAAAVVAAIFILRPTLSTVHHSPSTTVFNVEETEPQVTLLTADGKSIPVEVVRKHDKPDATIAIGQTQLELEEHLQLSVPHGEALQIDLADGTRAYLHPGSRLVYPTAFVGGRREVQFSGEAYFCVAKNPQQPFVVHTPQGDVQVYGTEFNVRTAQRTTEVVLVEGSVGVTTADGAELMMEPGQKWAMVDGQCTVTEVDTEPYVSWRDGYFHFEESTLGEILRVLGSYYNMSVVCYNPQLLSYRMRFIIPRNSTPEYAVEMVNRMGKVHAILRGESIVVGY